MASNPSEPYQSGVDPVWCKKDVVRELERGVPMSPPLRGRVDWHDSEAIWQPGGELEQFSSILEALRVRPIDAANAAHFGQITCPIRAADANRVLACIDVGDLDRVIQVDAPATVASFSQRLGRSRRDPASRSTTRWGSGSSTGGRVRRPRPKSAASSRLRSIRIAPACMCAASGATCISATRPRRSYCGSPGASSP